MDTFINAIASLFSAFPLTLLALSALCSATETAFLTLPEGSTGLPRAAVRAVKDISSTIISIVITNNAINIGGGMLLGGWAIEKLGADGAQAFSVVFTIAVMVFGEIIPKALGAAQAALVVRATSPTVLGLNWLLTPLAAGLTFITDLLPKNETPQREVELVASVRRLDETPVSSMMKLIRRGYTPLVDPSAERSQRFYSAIHSDVECDRALDALVARSATGISTSSWEEIDTTLVVVSVENTAIPIGLLDDRQALLYIKQ